MNWILENKEWLFSGVGVVLILGIIRYFGNKKKLQNGNNAGVSVNQAMGNGMTAKNGDVILMGNKQKSNINTDKQKDKEDTKP